MGWGNWYWGAQVTAPWGGNLGCPESPLFGSAESEEEEGSAVVSKEAEAIEEMAVQLLQRCRHDSI